MSTDDDGDWTGTAVTQDPVDFIERHAVHRGIIDFHNLIATPAKAPIGSHEEATDQDI